MNRYFYKSIWRKLICLLVCFLCTGTISAESLATHTTQQSIQDVEREKKIDQLLLLMQKRLAIMHEVSRAKWNQNLPIEDKLREQQILIGLVNRGIKNGLDEKWIAKFFQAQFDAAKEIQKEDFSLWQEQKTLKFEKVFSLKDELRSYIDTINQEIIELLSEIYERNSENAVSKYVLDHPISTRISDHIEEHIWQMATSPLKTARVNGRMGAKT